MKTNTARKDQLLASRDADLKARLQRTLGELEGILDQIEAMPDGLDSMVHKDIETAWDAVEEVLINFDGWTNQGTPVDAAA